jgi:hypothetical protein
MSRRRVFIQPFTPAGAYTGTWIEVTDDVTESGLGTISKKLDVSDYDIGVYTNSGVSLTLRNDHGKYSDVGSVTTIFSFKRNDSLVRITWDLADYDNFSGSSRSDDIVGTDAVIFEGLLNDDSTVMQLQSQTVTFNVLGYESVFDRAVVTDWTPASNKASDLIKAILPPANASMTQPVLTIDNSRIVPGNDITFDSLPAVNKTCRDLLNDVLQASNSVLYMDGTTPVVSSRTASAAILYSFYGPGSSLGAENILDIVDIRGGTNRTFNFLTYNSLPSPVSSDLTSISRYGYRLKDITSIDGITDATPITGTIQKILDAIKIEFGLPKQEFTLISPLNFGILALPLLAQVSIDFPLVPISDSNFALYGIAQYGIGQYPGTLSSFQILPTETYKIIGMEINAAEDTVSLNMRRI